MVNILQPQAQKLSERANAGELLPPNSTSARPGAPSRGYAIVAASNCDAVGVIQKRIVQSLYSDHIVVCDVSCKNPNVMFELGMRLAFDKPTVIVKDDKTDYTFDTGIIDHLSYPRDLRFSKIVDFKLQLATKVVATYTAGQNGHSPFLKNFGQFSVATLDQKEVPAIEAILETLQDLQRQVAVLNRSIEPRRRIDEARRRERERYGPTSIIDGILSFAYSHGGVLPSTVTPELVNFITDRLREAGRRYIGNGVEAEIAATLHRLASAPVENVGLQSFLSGNTSTGND